MRRAWALLVLALVASGCEVATSLEVTVRRGGSGTFGLAVALDEELAGQLRVAGVDVTRGADQLDVPGWDVRVDDEGPGVAVAATTGFDQPGGLAARAGELQGALGPDDVRLFDGLSLEALPDGAVAFSGQVGLIPPAGPGARGVGVDADRRDLVELSRDAFRGVLVVRLPAAPRRHDADRVEGTTLEWDLPVGQMRAVEAVSEVPPLLGPWELAAVAVVTVAAAALTVAAVVRRRRRRAAT